MGIPIQRGYLVLADISGFTEFLVDSELDHAPHILKNLINFLLDRLTSALTLAEVEGDAVFAYASADELSRGELLLELVERTYVDFRDTQRSLVHNLACPCFACQLVPTLNLKFVVHFGEYVLQQVAGRTKPVGTAVNAAHRLLKNGIEKETGWRGYALFTQDALREMRVRPDGLHVSSETYEHLGTIETGTIDLQARYEAFDTLRVVRLAAEEAHVVREFQFSEPPPIIWDWLNDPVKRNLCTGVSDWVEEDRPTGRTGPSSKNHCLRSGTVEVVLDWHPFKYYTVRQEFGPLKCTATSELASEEGGTRLRWIMRLESRLPQSLLRAIARQISDRFMRMPAYFESVEQHSIDARRPARRYAAAS